MLRLGQILGALLLVISINTQPADAVTVNTDGSGHATSVTDLTVGTTIYDVSFLAIFEAADLVINFTSATAPTAVDSLDAALNAADVTAIRYPLSAIRYPLSAIRYPLSAIRYPNVTTGSFAIAISDSGNTATYFDGFYSGGSWQADSSSHVMLFPGDEFLYVADFTPVGATPLPAALPLFATGLGGLGLLGWRRKRKNTAALAAA